MGHRHRRFPRPGPGRLRCGLVKLLNLSNCKILCSGFRPVYLFRRDQTTWVLFLEATVGAGKRQRLQQNKLRSQSVSVRFGKGESLGVEKYLLEQRIKDFVCLRPTTVTSALAFFLQLYKPT